MRDTRFRKVAAVDMAGLKHADIGTVTASMRQMLHSV